jgi:hypothetical protein
MSDHAQLNVLPEDGGSSSSLADLPSRRALDAHNAYCPVNFSPTTKATRPKRERRNSTASHVDVDFFDPSGVRHLNRTLSRMSTRNEGDPESDSTNSDATLTTDGPFDFERTLRVIMKKCAFFPSCLFFLSYRKLTVL